MAPVGFGIIAALCWVQPAAQPARRLAIHRTAPVWAIASDSRELALSRAVPDECVTFGNSLECLTGDEMEDGWEKLRGRPLRRTLALWKFFALGTWKVVRGRRSEEAEAEAARWVRQGLLRLGPTMVRSLTLAQRAPSGLTARAQPARSDATPHPPRRSSLARSSPLAPTCSPRRTSRSW